MANKKRGYYQLNIGGKLRTLHFSMNFWVNFTDLLGLNLDELDSVFSKGVSIKNIRTLIYSGLLAYDQENGNEIDYNEFNVGDWLSDLSPNHLEKIVLAMTESKILGQDLNMGINRKQDVKIVNPEKKN